MSDPTNVKRTDWKWREYHNKGRLEAMTEIRDLLASTMYTEDIRAALADTWVMISAAVKQGGQWGSHNG